MTSPSAQKAAGEIADIFHYHFYGAESEPKRNVTEVIESAITEAVDAAVAPKEKRVKELEAALGQEISNCVNCGGKGRYVMHKEGGYEFTVTCERCAPARAALEAPHGP